MDTENEKHHHRNYGGGIIQVIASAYGPYAFGVISLLMIWFSIVKPELDRRAIDFAAHNEVLQSLVTRDAQQVILAATMQETASSIATAARLLEQTIGRLEHLEEARTRNGTHNRPSAGGVGQ